MFFWMRKLTKKLLIFFIVVIIPLWYCLQLFVSKSFIEEPTSNLTTNTQINIMKLKFFLHLLSFQNKVAFI